MIMSFKIELFYLENGFSGHFFVVFKHIEYQPTIIGSNANIYNSKNEQNIYKNKLGLSIYLFTLNLIQL